MWFLILLVLFLLGAHGLRIRFRSALAESTAIREQMDRHDAAVTALMCSRPDTLDYEMMNFELALLDGVWNRLEERYARFAKWAWFYRMPARTGVR